MTKRQRRGASAFTGLLVSMLFVLLPMSPARAATSCTDYLSDIALYLACGNPSITIVPASITPGNNITVDLVGWLPGSTVAITITCNGTPITIGSVTIGTDSRGTGIFTVPSDCPIGPQVVTGTGPDMLDATVSREGPVLVMGITSTTAAGGGRSGGGNNPGGGTGTGIAGTGTLPPTGSSAGRLVTIGAALIVIGAGALYGSLRSRRANRIE